MRDILDGEEEAYLDSEIKGIEGIALPLRQKLLVEGLLILIDDPGRSMLKRVPAEGAEKNEDVIYLVALEKSLSRLKARRSEIKKTKVPAVKDFTQDEMPSRRVPRDPKDDVLINFPIPQISDNKGDKE